MTICPLPYDHVGEPIGQSSVVGFMETSLISRQIGSVEFRNINVMDAFNPFDLWTHFIILICSLSIFMGLIAIKSMSNYGSIAWNMIRGFCNQTSIPSKLIQLLIQKLIWFFYLLLIFFIFAALNGNLSTDFVVPIRPKVVDTLEDIIEVNCTPIFYEGHFANEDFSESMNPLNQKIWKMAKERGGVVTSTLPDIGNVCGVIEKSIGFGYKYIGCNQNPPLLLYLSEQVLRMYQLGYGYNKNVSKEFKLEVDKMWVKYLLSLFVEYRFEFDES